jgi:S-adenosyl methyltransferase
MAAGWAEFLGIVEDTGARPRHRAARRLMAPLAPGSCLAVTHLARDVAGDALTETFSRLNAEMAESVVLRTREEVAALFGGLEMIEPGVVQLPQWHPDPDAPAPGPLPMWCGVGRKTADR